MSDDDKEYMPFYRVACDALNEATHKVRSKGAKLSQIDQISALTMAHLRVAALLLAEMTKHVARAASSVRRAAIQ
jgi:hypothetical protein